MKRNGSPTAKIETDDERSYFLLRIPIRDGFTVSDVTTNVTDRQKEILKAIADVPNLTNTDFAVRFGVTTRTIKRDLQKLNELGFIRHMGATKNGQWEIIMHINDDPQK